MRGAFEDQGGLFSYISPEARVPTSHPLRKIRELVREVLGELNRSLGKLYASEGEIDRFVGIVVRERVDIVDQALVHLCTRRRQVFELVIKNLVQRLVAVSFLMHMCPPHAVGHQRVVESIEDRLEQDAALLGGFAFG